MSTPIQPLLSLVIPAYQEAGRLPKTLQVLQDHAASWRFRFEIIVVVEPCPDATLEIAQQKCASFSELRIIANSVHRGKGFAVKTGMRAATGTLHFFTDADLSTPLADLDRAIAIFQAQPEVSILIGNRQHPESLIVQRQNRVRESMGKTFNYLVRILGGADVRDTQCGFKGFRECASREIFRRLTTDGFSFDVEALLLARSMHFKIVDMPVHWSNSPESKVHVVQDSLRMLRDVLAVRRRVNRQMRDDPYVPTAEPTGKLAESAH